MWKIVLQWLILIINMTDDKKQEETTSKFGELLQDYFAEVPKVGEIVKGSVISVDHGAVRVDVNGLTTGIVRGIELFSESSEF